MAKIVEQLVLCIEEKSKDLFLWRAFNKEEEECERILCHNL